MALFILPKILDDKEMLQIHKSLRDKIEIGFANINDLVVTELFQLRGSLAKAANLREKDRQLDVMMQNQNSLMPGFLEIMKAQIPQLMRRKDDLIVAFKNRNAELEHKYRCLENNMKRSIFDWNSQKDSFEKKIQEQNTVISGFQNDKLRLEQEYKFIQKSRTEYSQTLTNQEYEIKNFKDGVQSFNASVLELKLHNGKNARNLDDQTLQYQKIANQELNSIIVKINETIANLEKYKKSDSSTDYINILQSSLNMSTAKNKELEDKIKMLEVKQQELQKLTKEIDVMRKNHATQVEELNDKRVNLESTIKRLEEQQKIESEQKDKNLEDFELVKTKLLNNWEKNDADRKKVIDELQEKITVFETTAASISKELEDEKEKFKNERIAFENTIKKMNDDHHNLTIQQRKHQNKRRNINRNKIKMIKRQIKGLKDDKEKLIAENAQNLKDIEKLKLVRQKFMKQIEHLENKGKSDSSSIESLKLQIQGIKDEKEKLIGEHQKIQDEDKQKLKNIKNSMNESATQIKGLKDDREKLIVENKQKSEDIEKLNLEKENFMKQIEHLENKGKSDSSSIDSLTIQIQDIRDEKDKLTVEHQKIQDMDKQKLMDLENSLNESATQIKGLKDDREKLILENKQKLKDIEKLNLAGQKLSNQIEQLENKGKSDSSSIDSLTIQIQDIRDENVKLTGEHQKIRDELMDLDNSQNKSATQIKGLKQKLDDIKNLIIEELKLRQEIKDQEEQRISNSRLINSLNTQIQEIKDENDTLKLENEQNLNKRKKYEEEREHKIYELQDKIRKELEDEIEKQKNLIKIVRKLKKELQQLQLENKQKRNDLAISKLVKAQNLREKRKFEQEREIKIDNLQEMLKNMETAVTSSKLVKNESTQKDLEMTLLKSKWEVDADEPAMNSTNSNQNSESNKPTKSRKRKQVSSVELENAELESIDSFIYSTNKKPDSNGSTMFSKRKQVFPVIEKDIATDQDDDLTCNRCHKKYKDNDSLLFHKTMCQIMDRFK